MGTKNIGNEKDGELRVWSAGDVGLKASKLLDGPCAAGGAQAWWVFKALRARHSYKM